MYLTAKKKSLKKYKEHGLQTLTNVDLSLSLAAADLGRVPLLF